MKRPRTRLDNLAEGKPVRRVLGDGLAEVKRLTSPVVDDERQMVGRDGAGDSVAAGLNLSKARYESSKRRAIGKGPEEKRNEQQRQRPRLWRARGRCEASERPDEFCGDARGRSPRR